MRRSKATTTRFPTSRQISIMMLHTQDDSDDQDPNHEPCRVEYTAVLDNEWLLLVVRLAGELNGRRHARSAGANESQQMPNVLGMAGW